MKKMPLLLLFLAGLIQATGQDKTVAQLRKELENHPQPDVFRADKLIDLAFNGFFSYDERKKFGEEALFVSRKINYTLGEAYALTSIGYYKSIDGNVREGDSLLKHAESLAEKLGNPDLNGTLRY